MKSLLSVKKAVFICTAVLLALSFTSWKQGAAYTAQTTRDTVPEKKIKDLDEALSELDNAKDDLEKSIKDIDWDKMNADLKEAMKSMNADLKQMNADLKKQLQEVDVNKMKQDVETAMAKIDWDKIKTEIQKAKEINLDSLKTDMAQAKKSIEKMRPELEKSLQDARQNIEKAKAKMQGYKGFIDGLEQDGLISKKEAYTIEHKDGHLLINGNQQSSAVYNKYKPFLEKNQKFTIKKNESGFTINDD